MEYIFQANLQLLHLAHSDYRTVRNDNNDVHDQQYLCLELDNSLPHSRYRPAFIFTKQERGMG